MKKKMSRTRIVVYVFVGVVLLALCAVAAIYLPSIMQSMHGVG